MFSVRLLRSNSLVWHYVVRGYLFGEAPPPFDLLYWNGDSTNLPGPMYCWYLRHMYLQNELRKPGALTVCGQKVDLGRIKAPVYIYGSREDHIVPWMAAAWLKAQAGGQAAAPRTYGSRAFKAIEPAPGRYVKAKA